MNEASSYGGIPNRLKALTGGYSLRLEQKDGKSGSFVFKGSVVLVGNSPTKLDDYSNAM